MSNAIKHCKDCNTTVMCHLERRCQREAHGLSAVAGSALGYALCKCWKDNPNDLAVHEYYGTLEDAKEAKRSEKKDSRYTWVIAEYK